MSATPYELLGVAPDADRETLRTAYRRRARELHPDANPDDASATRRFQELAAAYALLTDPQRRTAHGTHERGWPGRSSDTAGRHVLTEVRVLVRPGHPAVGRRVVLPEPARPVATAGAWWTLTPGAGAPAREFSLSIAPPPGARGVLRDALLFDVGGDVVTVPVVARVVG